MNSYRDFHCSIKDIEKVYQPLLLVEKVCPDDNIDSTRHNRFNILPYYTDYARTENSEEQSVKLSYD